MSLGGINDGPINSAPINADGSVEEPATFPQDLFPTQLVVTETSRTLALSETIRTLTFDEASS